MQNLEMNAAQSILFQLGGNCVHMALGLRFFKFGPEKADHGLDLGDASALSVAASQKKTRKIGYGAILRSSFEKTRRNEGKAKAKRQFANRRG